MIDGRELIKLFFLFEQKEADFIGKERIDDFLVWPIIKSPLCYSYLSQVSVTQSTEIKSGNKWLNLITKSFSAISFLLKTNLSAKFRHKVLVYAKTVDKQSKKDHKYINYITDGWILEGAVQNYFYTEYADSGIYREPSLIPIAFRLNNLDILSIVIPKKKLKSKVSNIALSITQKINEFLKVSGSELQIALSEVEEILIRFLVTKKISSIFLKSIRPSTIITSEKLGTGFYAAANKMKIPVIDLQHGIIDQYEPMYQYAETLKPYKASMLLPDFIGVWGGFHQHMLLQHNFWHLSEIPIIGNYRMYLRGLQNHSGSGKDNSILLPTQWTVFNESKLLLNNMAACNERNFSLIIKLHPMEPESFREFYINFAETHSHWVTIKYPKDDIYELISRSKLLIGFNSTSMIEAAALDTPSITLTTPLMPKGIYEFLGDNISKKGIKPIELTNTSEILNTIDLAITDKDFYSEWQSNAREAGQLFFADNFDKRSRALMEQLINLNKGN